MNPYQNQNDIFAITQKSLRTPVDPWAFKIQHTDSQNTYKNFGKPILYSEICSFTADWELPKMEIVV